LNNQFFFFICLLFLISCGTTVPLLAESPVDLEEQIFGKKRREAETKAKEATAARKKAIEELKKTRQNLESIHEQNKQLDQRNDSLSQIRSQLNNSLYEREREIEKMYQDRLQTEWELVENKRVVDSLEMRSMVDSMEILQQQLVLDQQAVKIRDHAMVRNLFIALAVILGLIAFILFNRWRITKKYNLLLEEKNNAIIIEQQKSEALLLNILPYSIAEELKLSGTAEAKRHPSVTVLFSDFVNFSQITASKNPKALVADLDYCFKAFDAIIEKNKLEKIKTIGDAYMCAGGLPIASEDHAHRIMQAAIDMQTFLKNWALANEDKNEPVFTARIGIHTGPLIAGVVGDKKFAYDIWGDTVNIASRMESAAEAGRINVSSTTYELLKNDFAFIARGSIEAKNVGALRMYFLEI